MQSYVFDMMKLFICLLHLQSSLLKSLTKTKKGRKWSIGTLNRVLRDVLVPFAYGTQTAVIGCAEWESEKFAGVTNLNVRTFDVSRVKQTGSYSM